MTPANDNLEPIYTLAEAAGILRMTNRGVAKIAKRHGLCMVNGRHITFTAGDIERIKDVMRCPSKFTSAAQSIGYEVPSGELDRTASGKASVSEKARQLVISRSRKPSVQKLKAAS